MCGVPETLLPRVLLLRAVVDDAVGVGPPDSDVPDLRASSPSVSSFMGGRGATSLAASVIASVRSTEEEL